MLLTLSFLHMWRERYYPEFKIMALALFLAVFSITILISLSQVLQQSVNKDASKLLGADLVVESSDPLPKTFEQYAQKHFTTALVVDFFSMIQARENSLLVDVSAIDGDTFPLRGELKVKKDNQIFISHQAVAPGHIWLEESLAIKLGVHEKEQVMIGDASFNIDGLLMERPIALSSSSVLAPVVYVNAKDLAKMAVLQPGSRATYRLLLVGSQDSLLALKKQFHHVSNITWITANEGRPAVSRLLVYSQRYLSVIILIQIILAGIAIALCSHQYSLRQQRNMALFKSFGASNNLILSLQFLCMCMLALFVLVFAIITAYAICFGILTSSHFSYLGAKMNWQGAAFGGASGLLILLGFGLGPLWRLKQVSPLQLLQQQAQVRGKFNSLPSVIAVILLIILYQFYFQEPLFALSIAGQIAGVSAIAFAMGYLLWNLFGELSKRTPIAWRFAISYMVRYKSSSIIQWFVFMIVIMLLLLVQIIQHDFISSWKSQLSENTPNYFLLNIQASQVGELKEWFNENQIENVNFYPIVRGRMSHINGKSIDEINLGAKEKKGLGRSINLTWMITLPQDNRVIKGVNWGTVPENEHVISIEEQFAQRQGVGIGDTIGFSVADQEVAGKIVQIRTVQWESFKPNFFIIFPPKVLENFPHTYITSVYLPASQKAALIQLTKKYVEISVIDIDELLTKARDVIDKISIGLQLLLYMVFIFGVCIMYASILSCLKERLTEGAMLQILGANKTFVLKVLLIEFSILGVLCALGGSIMAFILANSIADKFFDFALNINMLWLLSYTLVSIMVVVIFGLVGTRKVFQVSPLWLLKKTAS